MNELMKRVKNVVDKQDEIIPKPVEPVKRPETELISHQSAKGRKTLYKTTAPASKENKKSNIALNLSHPNTLAQVG